MNYHLLGAVLGLAAALALCNSAHAGSSAAAVDMLVTELVQQLSASTTQGQKLSVAVGDLTDLNDCSSVFGRLVGDQLATMLVVSGRFDVIERQHLEAVLAELHLQGSDLTDPKTAKQVGQFLGVKGLVVGTVSPLGSDVRVNLRIVDTESARAIAAASGTIEADSSLSEMVENKLSSCGTGSPVTASQPTPSPQPAPAARNGVLKWTYYNMPPWEGTSAPSIAGMTPALVEYALNLERDIKSGSPGKGVSADYFVAVATGEVYIETSGTYLLKIGQDLMHQTISFTIGTNTLTVAGRSDYDEERQVYFAKAGWYPLILRIEGQDLHNEWRVQWRRPGDSSLMSISPQLIRASQ